MNAVKIHRTEPTCCGTRFQKTESRDRGLHKTIRREQVTQLPNYVELYKKLDARCAKNTQQRTASRRRIAKGEVHQKKKPCST